MRLKVLINLLVILALVTTARAGEEATPLQVLSSTPYVDVARRTLREMTYDIEAGRLMPGGDLVDALVPIIKNEPYLLKEALDVLSYVPERFFQGRDDLYQALESQAPRPEVIDFLGRHHGPREKRILIRVAIEGPAEAADRAMGALGEFDLDQRDLKMLLEGYVPRKTGFYFYPLQYLEGHPEKTPSLKEDALRRLYFLLYDERFCSQGVAIFKASGREGLRLLFKRYLLGRIAQGCSKSARRKCRFFLVRGDIKGLFRTLSKKSSDHFFSSFPNSDSEQSEFGLMRFPC